MPNQRTILLSLALLGLARIAEGQEPTDSVKVEWVKPRWTTGSLNVQVGTAHLGLDALNDSFTRNGRPVFSASVATFGFSGNIRLNRLMIGVGGESARGHREETAQWISKISFGSATLDAGVAVVDAGGVLIAPRLSIGVRKTSLHMDRPGDFTYDEGVLDPARGVSLSTREGLVGFGLLAEKHFQTRITGAFSFGVQAGVARPFGGPATFAGESHVHGTPRQDAGRYLRFSVGRPIGSRRDAFTAITGALASVIGG